MSGKFLFGFCSIVAVFAVLALTYLFIADTMAVVGGIVVIAAIGFVVSQDRVMRLVAMVGIVLVVMALIVGGFTLLVEELDNIALKNRIADLENQAPSMNIDLNDRGQMEKKFTIQWEDITYFYAKMLSAWLFLQVLITLALKILFRNQPQPFLGPILEIIKWLIIGYIALSAMPQSRNSETMEAIYSAFNYGAARSILVLVVLKWSQKVINFVLKIGAHETKGSFYADIVLTVLTGGVALSYKVINPAMFEVDFINNLAIGSGAIVNDLVIATAAGLIFYLALVNGLSQIKSVAIKALTG